MDLVISDQSCILLDLAGTGGRAGKGSRADDDEGDELKLKMYETVRRNLMMGKQRQRKKRR